MSYLDDLVKAQNDPLFEEHIEPVERTEQQAIVSDTYDKMTWDVLQVQAPSLGAMGERMEQEHFTGKAVEEDVFNLLYQSTPMMRDPATMKPEYAHSQHVLGDLVETEEVQALRKQTQLDEYQTAFAMLGMEPQLKEAMVVLKEIHEREQEAAQNLANAKASNDPNAIAQAQAEAVAVDDKNRQAGQQMQQQIQQAAGDTAQEINEHNDAMARYGIGESQLSQMNFENRRALSQRLHRGRLARLAAMIGQFKAYGRGERRKRAKHAKAEVYDYELSNDLTQLVPEEMNNLAIPELEDQFWMRWAQHGLLTRKERGPLRVGRGPILVVCDESGSMGTDIHTGQYHWDDDEKAALAETREMWSKAVVFALSEQAKMEKRDFSYIGFASTSQLYQKDFKKGQVDLDGITELVEHFFNGGTDYKPALKTARKIIEDSIKRDEERADIVFITDGDCRVPEDFITDWRKFCEDADIHTFGIKVGTEFNGRGTLEQIATRVISINKLNATPEGVQELFAKI